MNAIALMQQKVIERMLPDVCSIVSYTKTVNSFGVPVEDTEVFVEYNGSTNVPCRIDYSPSYRTESMPKQITDATEIDLQLPYDCTITLKHFVILNDAKYSVSKLMIDSNWKASIVAKITKST